MPSSWEHFQFVARSAQQFTDSTSRGEGSQHPFDIKNIHEKFPPKVRKLFDDGHYAQATFEAFKFVDKQVQKISKSSKSGNALMMSVFGGNPAPLQLTPQTTQSENDEQDGYRFLFAGSILAIRNPRGHEYDVEDDPDKCLDHLGLASILLRRLGEAGFTFGV